MTNRHSNSVLEQEMIDCLRRQKAYYDQATLIADEITNTMQSGVADESALTKLKAILEEVAGWETRTQGMRQRWRDAFIA